VRPAPSGRGLTRFTSCWLAPYGSGSSEKSFLTVLPAGTNVKDGLSNDT
jgi:hypothetical protein